MFLAVENKNPVCVTSRHPCPVIPRSEVQNRRGFPLFEHSFEADRNVSPFLPGAASDLSPFIERYERLSYDREDLHRKHLRARRDARSLLQLDFTAFHR